MKEEEKCETVRNHLLIFECVLSRNSQENCCSVYVFLSEQYVYVYIHMSKPVSRHRQIYLTYIYRHRGIK
jgi:hypothetical protein